MYQLLSKNKSSYKNKILKSLNQTLKETRAKILLGEISN